MGELCQRPAVGPPHARAGPRASRGRARPAAGVHGAERLRGAGGTPRHRQRQGRPRGAPRARHLWFARGDVRGAAHAGRGADGGDLGGGAGGGAGGGGGPLLRAGRALAARHAAGVAGAGGVRAELPLRAVFEAPTLAELAGRVEALRAEALGDAGAPPLVPVPRDGRRCRCPSRSSGSGSSTGWSPGAPPTTPRRCACAGALDRGALERALGEMVRRHEALRTTFEESAARPVQVVHPAGAARAAAGDLSGLAPAEREARGPPARAGRGAASLRPGARDRSSGRGCCAWAKKITCWCWPCTTSSATAGAWGCSSASWGRSTRRSRAASRRRSRSCRCSTPTTPSGSAPGWRARSLERQLAWWRERLAGAPPVLELPTDRARPPMQGPRAGCVFRALPPGRRRGCGRWRGARAPRRTWCCSPRWTCCCRAGRGRRTWWSAPPIAGRTRRETEGLIGFFVNTLALRTDLSGDPVFRRCWDGCGRRRWSAYQHQDVPFERLVEELQPERSLSHTPLFQVVFSLNDGAAGGTRPWGGLAVEPYGAGRGAAKFDLDVMVVEQEGGLGVGFTYREELWDASTLERVAGAYALLLEAAAADPGRPVFALPLVSEAERERPAGGVQRPAARLPGGAACHDLFAAQAARTPHAPALVHAGEVLDYAGLERAPTGSRTTFAAWARVRRPAWASAWRAARSWWSPCSPSSRRAAPTSRSTPRTRRSGWAGCSRMRGSPWSSPTRPSRIASGERGRAPSAGPGARRDRGGIR